jgi:hypothetical protein
VRARASRAALRAPASPSPTIDVSTITKNQFRDLISLARKRFAWDNTTVNLFTIVIIENPCDALAVCSILAVVRCAEASLHPPAAAAAEDRHWNNCSLSHVLALLWLIFKLTSDFSLIVISSAGFTLAAGNS